MSGSIAPLVPILLTISTLIAPAALAQTADFGGGEIDVVSEWRGQDRGDGSGSYSLVTTAVDRSSGIAIEHARGQERTVEGEEVSSEALRVLDGNQERARAEDPSSLGSYSEPAAIYVIPFGSDFRADPRTNYRPQQKKIVEIVSGVVEGARVSLRSSSDGRTTATIELPEPLPADALAERFVGIRGALRDADLGFAKLVIKGRALAPATAGSTPAGEPAGSS